jgi:hypothetical protein
LDRRDACPTILEVAQLLHFSQILEDLLRFRLINAAERKADMHDNVVADLHFGHISKADLPKDAAEIDFTGTQQRVVAADAGHFTWDSQTHCYQAYTRAGGGAMMGREEIRKPKPETRKKTEGRISNTPPSQGFGSQSKQAILGFRISAFFRVSGFGLRN